MVDLYVNWMIRVFIFIINIKNSPLPAKSHHHLSKKRLKKDNMTISKIFFSKDVFTYRLPPFPTFYLFNPVRTLVRLSRYLFFQNDTSIFFKMGSRFDQRKRHKKSNFKVKWYLFYQNDTFFTKKRSLIFSNNKALFEKSPFFAQKGTVVE